MTGQESQFGAELDSLCDAITFEQPRPSLSGSTVKVLVYQEK